MRSRISLNVLQRALNICRGCPWGVRSGGFRHTHRHRRNSFISRSSSFPEAARRFGKLELHIVLVGRETPDFSNAAKHLRPGVLVRENKWFAQGNEAPQAHHPAHLTYA